MKFPTAREVRKMSGEADRTSLKMAKKVFKENKKEILEKIISATKNGRTEQSFDLFYPISVIIVDKIYEEEYKRIATEFFVPLGYKVFFGSAPSIASTNVWSRLWLNWEGNEE